MTKHFLCLFAILLLAINFSFGQNTIDVKPDPTREYQTIEGWGSSLCWWAHMIGQWQDEQKIDQIVDLITSPDKLNMNIFRYNIGGGDDPSHYSTPGHPGHMASGKGVRAEMPGFKLSETAPYDWTADAGQRRILLKIKEKRPDAIFEAFSNSPPYWMTYSGCSAGNNPANADNLKPDYYGQFCDYLVEVCKHYKDTFGVEFKTLEPFNESLSNYWGYLGGQEGCHFDVSSQISLLRVLYPKLQDSGLNTVISASDETNISSFIYATNNYIGAGDIIGKLGQQNTHTYSGSDAERREAYNLTRETGKTFWMSETGPSGISESGLTNNLQLAQKMFNDLRYMKPSAWIDWQLMEEGNDTWCQLRADFGNETYAIVKNFYVRMQVTRFIKKGYRLIESGNDHVLTAVSPDGDQLAVVVLNQSQSGESFSIDLSKFPQTGRSAQTYRTSSSENCQRIADSNTSDQHLNYFAPAQSITSFVIPVKFTRYSQFQLIKGIHFENDSLGGFEGQNLNLAENPRTNGLNNSIHSLSINLSTNPEFFYQLEDTFYTSNDYRYLHIMSYSADAEGSANNSSDSIIRIDAGNEWKDQVIDLGENNSFMQLAFQSSASSGTLLLDNICINGDPHPRTVSKEAPTFDFESSQGTPLLEIRSTPGHHPSTNIAINKKIVGLNTTHQFLEYISPVVKNPINTEDTLVIQLGSPLQITSATRYLHVLINSPATKMNLGVAGNSRNMSIATDQWVDAVLDLNGMTGENAYEIKLSVYGSTQLRTILSLGEITFNDQSSPRSYSFHAPEAATYAIFSRNSENVLAASNLNIIQQSPDYTSQNLAQQWVFEPVEGAYTITNKANGKVITDNGTYFLDLSNRSSDLDGQIFSVAETDGGYVKIVSLKTGKAIDVEGASTASGANIGVWDFGTSGNDHRQWALVKLKDTPTSSPSLLQKDEMAWLSSGAGKLSVHNLPSTCHLNIYNLNGVSLEKMKTQNSSCSFSLPSGLYIVHVDSNTQSYSLKGFVF